jgi:hypothetical protein
MKNNSRVCTAVGGALGFGGFAAALGLCCGVPWGVTLLGVTGAVAFARLAFLLPYALVGAAALLSYAFWLAYRAQPYGDVDLTDSRRWLRRVVWGATVVVITLAVIALTGRISLN